jgi:hypothetical protein
MGNFINDIYSDSQKVANWLCSDIERNLLIYCHIIRNYFDQHNIPLGVIPEINGRYIYIWTTKDRRGTLISFSLRNDPTDDVLTPKEKITKWSSPYNIELPSVYEGILHSDEIFKHYLLNESISYPNALTRNMDQSITYDFTILLELNYIKENIRVITINNILQ